MSALSGLRVLDVSQVLAGPYAAMLLGDLGADVVKVEAPGHGDHSRQMAPRISDDLSGAFLAVNRNKRGVSLDLKHPEGRALMHRLAATADVLIENFRPGVAARLGIDYATLAEVNPRLVHCSISGFGQTGPYASRGGFDLVAQGMSGLMSVTGTASGDPVKCGIPVTDLGAGMFAVYGILAALAARERTGRGQQVDTSLFETGLGLEVWETVEYFHTGNTPRPTGSAHRLGAPYQAFRCSDGYINVGADGARHWPVFCKTIGAPALADDPRFATNPDRLENLAELVRLIEERTEVEPRSHWLRLLEDVGIPAGPINSVPEALADPQAVARNMVVEVEHPRLGTLRALGPVVKLSDTPAEITRTAPDLGQHTDEVLGELGLQAAELEALRAEGVLGVTGQVRVERAGHVLVLTLDNPPLNIITAQMRPLILDGLRVAAEDSSVRCVVLTGAGDRAFCAGADLREEAELTPQTVRQFLDDDCAIFDGIEDLPVPVIAAVNGHCMGGGFEVALSCDIRIAADDAKLCGAGVKVGLVVSTARLTRLAGPGVAKDVLLTGRTFSGAEALRMGIVSAAVPRAEVLEHALAWADEIASRAPLAVRRTKTAVHEATELPFAAAMSRELDHFAALSATEDHKHAIAAFFAREQPQFNGR